jgi:hypothetical protein
VTFFVVAVLFDSLQRITQLAEVVGLAASEGVIQTLNDLEVRQPGKGVLHMLHYS